MAHLKVGRPGADEYVQFYAGYVEQVPEDDLLAALDTQSRKTSALLAGISETDALYRYAPGKWSIKQLIGHIADSERVFSFRAFWFARNAGRTLPGFDQDALVNNVDFEGRPWMDLILDLEHVRRTTADLFDGFDASAWARRGVANDAEVSVRALGYVLLGHERHHVEVLKSRYLSNR